MFACGAAYMPNALGAVHGATPRTVGAPKRRTRPRACKAAASTNLLAELPTTHSGLLRRRRLLLGWSKPRMFVIKSGYLLCHPGAAERGQPHIVDLDGCAVPPVDDATRAREAKRSARQARRNGFAFTLVSPENRVVMRLKAESEAERAIWASFLSGVRRRHLSDFRRISTLGTGAFGQVSLVRETSESVEQAAASQRGSAASSVSARSQKSNASERFYALKEVALVANGDQNATSLRRAAEERAVLQRVGGHPFITQLHYAFMEGGKLHYVQGLGSGGDLYDNLRAQEGRRFPEPVVRFFAAELLLAIGHLHSLNVLHRDIKLENVLLDGEGHVMLCDFGLAKTLPTAASRSRSFVGTERYCPPEMWMDIGHGRAVDFWQLGCLVFELLTGRPPFYSKNKDRQRAAILSGKVRFPADSKLSDDATSFITALLARNTWERLGSGDDDIAEVQRHAFFKGVEWDAVLARRVCPPYVPPSSAELLAQLTEKDAEIKRKEREGAANKKSGAASAPTKLQQCLEDEFIGFDYAGDLTQSLGLLESDDEGDSDVMHGAVVSAPFRVVTAAHTGAVQALAVPPKPVLEATSSSEDAASAAGVSAPVRLERAPMPGMVAAGAGAGAGAGASAAAADAVAAAAAAAVVAAAASVVISQASASAEVASSCSSGVAAVDVTAGAGGMPLGLAA